MFLGLFSSSHKKKREIKKIWINGVVPKSLILSVFVCYWYDIGFIIVFNDHFWKRQTVRINCVFIFLIKKHSLFNRRNKKLVFVLFSVFNSMKLRNKNMHAVFCFHLNSCENTFIIFCCCSICFLLSPQFHS